MTRSSIAFGFVLGLTVTTAAHAALQPLTQLRRALAFVTVTAGEDFTHDSVTSDAPDFDLFDDTVSVTESLPGTSATGDAHHRSDLDDSSFFFVGDFTADAAAEVPGAFSEGFGQALFNLTFTVDEPSTIAIYGDLTAEGSGSSHFNFVGGGIVFTDSQTGPGTMAILEEFVLEAGVQYTVSTNTNGFGQAFDGTTTTAGGSISVNGFVSAVVAVPGADALADLRAHPNPTRGAATFELGDARGALTIFDASGRLVETLDASSSIVSWDGRTATGAAVAPGVYF
jgi:hypothetical protein